MKGSTHPQTERPRVVSRQLATAFLLVTGVAIVMCIALELLVVRLGDSVGAMQRDERAIRASFRLATAVRELYVHQAHSIIVGDRSHLDHYREWLHRVELASRSLSEVSDERTRGTIEKVNQLTGQLDGLFSSRILPLLGEAPDHPPMAEVHERIEALSLQAIVLADGLVQQAERGIAHRHVSATALTRAGMLTGGACMALVIFLALSSTLRLRRALLKPLTTLTRAAQHFGDGRFEQRLGVVGTGELQTLADAFDRMAIELQARERRLLRKERMALIGQIAAGVAHEVNNPIAVIRGYLKTMSPGESPEQLREELDIIDQEAAACQRIAEDLLTYSEVPRLRLAEVEMRDLIEETVIRFAEASGIDRRRIVVLLKPGQVSADSQRIRQVLMNLLKNAVAASPEAEVINIVGAPAADGSYAFSVSDAGRGIAAADRHKVFEPFFGKTSDGTGLGLAISRAIVDAHGGTIDVGRAERGGAQFSVALPARPPQEVE